MTHRRKSKIPAELLRTIHEYGVVILPKVEQRGNRSIVFMHGKHCAVRPHKFIERTEMEDASVARDREGNSIPTGRITAPSDYHDPESGRFIRTSEHPMSTHFEVGGPHEKEKKRGRRKKRRK